MQGRWLRKVAQMVWTGLRDPARRRRWGLLVRRACWLALALLLLLSCLGCLLLGILVGRATATGPDAGLDVLLVVDNSNSMFDKGGIGSDPDLRRIEAAQMFINYLGVDSGPVSHRLGVIFFGGQARLVVPLTPLADQARRADMAALIAGPQRMDWTDPAAALTLARQALLAETGGARQPIVVLLTDGKPEWGGDPNQAGRQSVIEELKGVGRQHAGDGIRLFVILLSNEATAADPEIDATYVPLWQELAETTRGSFYRVRRADDLIAVYHDVLVVLSGVRTAGLVVEAEVEGETQVETVPVEPNLARVTFVVRVSQPEATVTIHRPGGRALGPGDTDVRHASQATTAIWAIGRPQPGNWTVVMAGRGSVTVWKDYLPAPVTPTPSPAPTVTPSPVPMPRLVVGRWPEAVLAGQPITLSVAFEPAPPVPPSVWAQWAMEDGEPRRLRLLDDGRAGDVQAEDGWYAASLTSSGTGIAWVRVWGEAGGREIASWEGRVRVEPCPALELVTPQAGDVWRAGQPAVVRARWVAGGEPLEMGGRLTGTCRSPDGVAHTVLTGTVGEPISVRAPQEGGVYSLTVEAMGGFAGGPLFQGEVTTTVVVRRRLPWWAWVAAVGLFLAGLGGWGLRRWLRGLPRVAGRLRVLESPPGYAGPVLTDLALLDRRLVRLGGAQAELPLPAEGAPWATIRALADGSGMELSPCNGQAVRVNRYALNSPHVLSDGDCIATEGVRLRYECLRVARG